MKCRHCKKELEPNPLHAQIPRLNPWRHVDDQQFVCFDQFRHPLGTTAQPKEGEEEMQ